MNNRFSLAWLAILAVGLTGCRSTPTLHLAGTENGNRLDQSFSAGAFDRHASGDTIIVLDDQSQSARQVVIFRVLYKPRLGARSDHPTAVNAAIDWYFFADPRNASAGFLHYEGTGFVSMKTGKRVGKFEVRNATLALKERSGPVEDPIGRATLTGKFKIERDSGKISMIAQDLRALSAALPKEPTTATTNPMNDNQPPPRSTAP